jgi:hypothetical protein
MATNPIIPRRERPVLSDFEEARERDRAAALLIAAISIVCLAFAGAAVGLIGYLPVLLNWGPR